MGFGMQNGIRQGSLLSPYFYNVYCDSLNTRLACSGVGCHIAGVPTNNLSYADDIVLIAPSSQALNALVKVCTGFADENYLKFSSEKSVVMLLRSKYSMILIPQNIYLKDEILKYVDSFRYLGHIVTDDRKDDCDIQRERGALCARGNMITRNFAHCSKDVKIQLFKTYCYSFYTGALWSMHNQASLRRLKVTYNNIMRKLLYVPRWHSARHMFVQAGVESFDEVLRRLVYSFKCRVEASLNPLIVNLRRSDACQTSSLVPRWSQLLNIPVA